MENREARKIERALKRKAFGYTVQERVSDYEIEDRRVVEVKRRVHAKGTFGAVRGGAWGGTQPLARAPRGNG